MTINNIICNSILRIIANKLDKLPTHSNYSPPTICIKKMFENGNLKHLKSLRVNLSKINRFDREKKKTIIFPVQIATKSIFIWRISYFARFSNTKWFFSLENAFNKCLNNSF